MTTESTFDAAWIDASGDLMAEFGVDVTATLGRPCGSGVCGAGPCGSMVKAIKAILDWPFDDRPVAEMVRVPAPLVRVTVLNDDELGLVDSDLVQALKFTLAQRAGSAQTRTFRFSRIVKQDVGLITCEVR